MSDDIKLPKGVEIVLKQATGFFPVTMYTADQLRAAVLTDREGQGREYMGLLGLLADIRAAAGDPEGKLMQPELVEHIRALTARVAELEAQNGNLQAELDSVKEHSQDRERCLEAALKPFAISPHAALHDSSAYTYRSAKVADYRRAAALLAKGES